MILYILNICQMAQNHQAESLGDTTHQGFSYIRMIDDDWSVSAVFGHQKEAAMQVFHNFAWMRLRKDHST